jgi:hypothetical protein
MVRTISDSPTSDCTLMRGGNADRSAQIEMEWFGSQSSRTTSAPTCASSVPSITDAVDFPEPPFGEATAITGMGLTRFVKKPDLHIHPVRVKTWSS